MGVECMYYVMLNQYMQDSGYISTIGIHNPSHVCPYSQCPVLI